jgi:serine phosphatase RsbU (regulator of sigma subunit)
VVHLPAVAVLVVGLVLTGLFASASHTSYRRSEQMLTRLQTRLAATVLEESSADIRRRLAPAVLLAAHDGPASFASQISPSVGASGPCVGAALFDLGPAPRLVVSVGAPLEAPPPEPRTMAAITRARRSQSVAVTHVVGTGYQRFGYAMTASGPAGDYAVYAEQSLPANRRISVTAANPAANLYIAVYFGTTPDFRALVVSDAPHLPLTGIHAVQSFPFGADLLTLAAAPRRSLAGGFAANQTTIIAVGGSIISLLVAALVDVLVRRRRRAERQAAESRQVAETLQRSLLPSTLPTLDGVQLAARYQPATAGISVGGDWYDAVEAGGRLYFSVGDVAGHGLEAATLMGRLRTAIDAYMADGISPEEDLAKLARLIDDPLAGKFAIVICGWVDPVSGEVALANAGHPEPVVIHAGRCEVLGGDVGPPIGVGHQYRVTKWEMPLNATLIAYTDGLVERRGEAITEGIGRLCEAASVDLPLDRLLDRLLTDLVPNVAGDDIAVLALRRGP